MRLAQHGSIVFKCMVVVIGLLASIWAFTPVKAIALGEGIELQRFDPDNSHVGSQHNCGPMLNTPNGGTPKDANHDEPRHRPAEQKPSGNEFEKGGIYCYDQCTGKYYAEAVKWFRKAAEQGYPGAQFNLGLMYKYGCGVLQDFSKAFIWFAKSAEQGDSRAQFNLALLYYKGQGTQENHSEAAKWYRRAAEQGNFHAQSNLGTMYFYGQGVEQDYGEAARWFHKAAEQAYSGAQYNLGIMCQYGQGVQQDYAKAHMWLTLSGVDGNEMAANAKAAIAEIMTPAQLLESEKLVREWKAKK